MVVFEHQHEYLLDQGGVEYPLELLEVGIGGVFQEVVDEVDASEGVSAVKGLQLVGRFSALLVHVGLVAVK